MNTELFYTYYKEGLNDREIAEKLQCSDSTVFELRKKNELSKNHVFRSGLEDFVEDIKRWKAEGIGNRKIAEKLNTTRDSVWYLYKKFNIANVQKRELRAIEFTPFQWQALIGCMLGDASVSNKWVFNIGHAEKQKKYFDHKVDLFKVFEFKVYNRTRTDRRTGNTYTGYQAYSKWFQNTKQLRQLFYLEGVKIIPESIFDDFSEVSLAYLYMDDGNYSRYTTTIALCNFSQEEIQSFQKFILNKWNIETKLQKNHSIRIYQKDISKFFTLITPHIIPSMYYKLGL